MACPPPLDERNGREMQNIDIFPNLFPLGMYIDDQQHIGINIGVHAAMMAFTPDTLALRVISHPRDVNRLRNLCSKIRDTDLFALSDSHIIPAVNGKSMSDDELRYVTTKQGYEDILSTEALGKRRFHYQLSRGAVGCYLSHLSVLRSLTIMVNNGEAKEFALVLEGDAHFPVSDVMRYADDVIQDVTKEAGGGDDDGGGWDLLLLGCVPVKYELDTKRLKSLRIRRFYGTHAMIVPVRRAAYLERLLGSGKNIGQQIDSALSDLAESGAIRIIAPSVNIVTQGNDNIDLSNPVGSTIQIPLIVEGGEDPDSPMPYSIVVSGKTERPP